MMNGYGRPLQAEFRHAAGRMPRPRGGALVVTVSLLVLLTVIAVGLLTLSSISLRSSASSSATAEARTNARLAMVMAIGELQKKLGPDQRISARAEILDRTPASVEVEGVANPHYLGVWDSWDTWLTDRKDSRSIQDTYKRGRDPSLFRGWLVSHPDADKYETAISSTPAADMIVMCGEGSAGPDPAGHVKARRLQMRSGNRITGGCAWWVDDESQKVRLDLPPRAEAGTVAEALVAAARTGRPGIEKMADMSGFDTRPEALAKMITTGEARISAAGADKHFHDITAYSLGLLTDVRSGGFKGDLNLAFESDTAPAEMDEARLFGGRPFDAPIRPMTGALADIVPQNPYVSPMSWRQLREHYRLYRGFAVSRVKQPVEWSGGEPFTRRYIMRGDTRCEWDSGGFARQLVLLRQTWVLATSSTVNSATPGGVDYYILAVPIVYLWNPYNIAMKVDSKEISSLGSMCYTTGMRQKLYRGNTLVRESLFPEPDLNDQGRTFKGDNHNLTANQAGYRMIATGTGGSGAIDFQPGEVRVFSTDTEILHGVNQLGAADAMTSRHFLATPGYTPVRDTGLLRGLKYRVYPGAGREAVSLSLRLEDAQHCDNVYFGATRRSAITYSMQEVLVSGNRLVTENGDPVTKQSEGEWHDVVRVGATSIDWDEFNAGYNGTTNGSGESINKACKAGDAMITESALPAKYPNPKAATGSRYAGIPGYVMQSDLLQGLAGSLSARGDTFLVRAYGESIAADGTVAAKAWCEAVVQRVPDYVDPADDPARKLRRAGQPPGAAPDLQPLNEKFGRRFHITSFRWLNHDEV